MTDQRKTVLLTGASGFIGKHLRAHLLKANYQIFAYSRHPSKQPEQTHLYWVDDLDQINQPIDYVINLAGENIGQSRWSQSRKQKLIDSRVNTTHQVYSWLSKQAQKPKRIISTSAVGYYGIDERETWQNVCNEDSPAQAIFMSALCQKWEQAALSYPEFDTKIMRLGVVFAKDGGILPQMMLPIKLNLVGQIASGRQPVVWVHIQDVLGIIDFLLHSESRETIFNAVAPAHTSQAEFAKTAAKLIKRTPFFKAPAFIFKSLLGEQSQLILNGQYVKPEALLKAGYQFQFESLAQALAEIYAKDSYVESSDIRKRSGE